VNPYLAWAQAAWIRALRTAAQVALATIGANAAGVVGIDWKALASIVVGAALASLLTSLSGLPELSSRTAVVEPVIPLSRLQAEPFVPVTPTVTVGE